ncbi:MAG: hypothetical protein ACLRVT_06090 [Oscillospiraceae bacterium]
MGIKPDALCWVPKEALPFPKERQGFFKVTEKSIQSPCRKSKIRPVFLPPQDTADYAGENLGTPKEKSPPSRRGDGGDFCGHTAVEKDCMIGAKVGLALPGFPVAREGGAAPPTGEPGAGWAGMPLFEPMGAGVSQALGAWFRS